MARAILEVLFSGKSDNLRKEIESAKQSVGDFKDSVGALAPALAAGFTVAGLAAFTKSTIEGGAHIYDLAQKLGTSTDIIQKFSYAAGQTGTDVETLTRGVLKAQSAIATGGAESAKYAKALELLGLNSQDLESQAPDEFLKRVADGFANCTDRGNANAAVVALFGSRMSAIIPLLAQGREGVEKLFADAPVQAEDTIDQFKSINDQLKQMGGQWKVVGGEIVSYVISAFTLVSATIRATLTGIIDEVVAAASALKDHPLNPSAAWDEFQDKSKEALDTFTMTMHEGAKLAGMFDLPAEKIKEYQDRLAETLKQTDELNAKIAATVKSGGKVSPEDQAYLKSLQENREILEKSLTDANQPLKPRAKFGVDEQIDGEKARQKAADEIARIEKEITAERERQAELGGTDEDRLAKMKQFVAAEPQRIAEAQKVAGVTPDSNEGKVIAEKERLETEKKITEELRLQSEIDKKHAEHAERMTGLQDQLKQAQDKNAEAGMTREEKINDLAKRRAALLAEAATQAEKHTDKDDEGAVKKRIEAERLTSEINGLEKQHSHLQIFSDSLRAVGGVGANTHAVTAGLNPQVKLAQEANHHLAAIAKNTAHKGQHSPSVSKFH